MKVFQVLNNNVAIVRLDDGEQAIAMGKGLVFNKKKGDRLNKQQVDKLFKLEGQNQEENIALLLLHDVPIDFITTTYEIVEHAKINYQFLTQEYIYVTLTDHIYWAYKRLENNELNNNLIPNMEKQYPIEYQISKDALAIIYRNLNISFPKEEIQSIALHFINAKGQSEETSKYENRNIKNVSEIVQEELNLQGIFRTDKNKNYYDRFMVHFNYFIDRLDEKSATDIEFTNDLLDQLQQRYPKSYQLATNIYTRLEHEFCIQINKSEELYLVIHIQRLIGESSKR
ncbi:PRD domain-containing protein [Vagococcus humatus]|uniref:Transcription antiterminator lact n=1 Tax=Vagococcus humatus TaxID=1889241 RepID=A0A429Z514_9ENTE|nr:PRD domain-containing protein [Vagococcus humatus]RST88786.1 transcription antiterminator lact [Vagococcus humatus]